VKVNWPGQFFAAAKVSVTAVRENVPVLLLTGVAFGGSYGHIAELCGKYGPHGWVQYATAGCVDLLCVIGAEERQRDKRIGRARNGKRVTWPTVILFIGILVTLAANAATADRNFLGYCVAAWPAAALLLAVSVLERRASYEIPLQIEQSELRAELERLRQELEAEQGAHAGTKAERDTALREAADTATPSEATLRAAEERHKADTATPQPSRRKSGTAARRSAPKDPVAQASEVVVSEQARIILDAEPDIAGSELGRRLGVQPSYGRRLKQRFASADAGDDR
jgi:hypothetical protein